MPRAPFSPSGMMSWGPDEMNSTVLADKAFTAAPRSGAITVVATDQRSARSYPVASGGHCAAQHIPETQCRDRKSSAVIRTFDPKMWFR